MEVCHETIKKGDHIRVVSPSSSIERIGGFEANIAAKEKLEALGSDSPFQNIILKMISLTLLRLLVELRTWRRLLRMKRLMPF